VQREFNRRVAQLFQERGIAIANPQRTVLVHGGTGVARQDTVEPSASSGPQAAPPVDKPPVPEANTGKPAAQ
jgi:moderate conductance mechanosensitive channel